VPRPVSFTLGVNIEIYMTKLQEVSLIIVGGALGGIISVADAWTNPLVFPVSLAKIFALVVIPLIKGGTAAGIGVYVLTSLDQNNMAKAFFFSVACGLTFPSILIKSGNMVDNVTSKVAQEAISENALAIKAATSNTSELSNLNVAEIQAASKKIIEAERQVATDDKGKAAPALQYAITALSKKAITGDVNAVEAITDIATLSGSNNISGKMAVHELKLLQNNQNLTNDFRSRVAFAVDNIEKAQ